ncbi:MAG: hypothetical protein AAF462_01360 [Thermodesulfobacteriota bacterium]
MAFKKSIILIFPLLVIGLYGGCSDNGPDCRFLEYEENLQNSECTAEAFLDIDLLRGCSIGIGCFSEEARINNFDSCTQVDCQTIECEEIFFDDEPTFGLLSNIELGVSDILNGDFIIDEMVIPFRCLFFQP